MIKAILELRAWVMSLGIDPAHIRVRIDFGNDTNYRRVIEQLQNDSSQRNISGYIAGIKVDFE